MAEEIQQYRIKVWERAEGVKNPLVDIPFEGTRVEADRKLGEMWDKTPCAHDFDGPRNRAALWIVGQRAAVSRIW